MKHKNPHVGKTLRAYVAEQRAKSPAFATAFDQLELAQRLRDLREEHGLTQAELAKRAQTTQPVIARMESGRVVPRLDLLKKVAVAMGLALKIDFERHAT